MENKKETIYLDFLGLPGSGKTTTAYKLKEELEKQGQEVLYFAEYWEKNMREYFLSLGKFKRHVLPVLYSLRDLRIWRIMFLYVLVFIENYREIKRYKIYLKNLFLFKFTFKKKKSLGGGRRRCIKNKFNVIIEDEGFVKILAHAGLYDGYSVGKVLNNLRFDKSMFKYQKKIFIHFRINDATLLIDRVINDSKRKEWESAKFWSQENSDALAKYYQKVFSKYEKLMELVKEKTKNQENLYFLELDAEDSVEANVEKIMEYLEKIKS